MSDSTESNPNLASSARGRHRYADFAPALVDYTEDVLFGQVWERGVISPKERSLVTVACLVALGSAEQLPYHLQRAQDNGATADELVETITHLAFYAGWPRAMAATAVAQQVLGSTPEDLNGAQ